MAITLTNSPLRGDFTAPPSKSVAHRLMIAATLAGGSPEDVLIPGSPSQDLTVTATCLRALKASATPVLDCGESGSTLRFLLPIAAALGKCAAYLGRGRLPERPIGTLLELLKSHGNIVAGNQLPLALAGRLQAGTFTLPGNISSQFITGLLFALPLLEAPSHLQLTTELESADYVRLTLDILKRFGVEIQTNASLTEFVWPRLSRYTLPNHLPLEVEGDWSNAAFFLAAGALGGDGITAHGLNPASVQGDRAIAQLLERFGAIVTWADNACTVKPGMLHAIPEIDVRAIPDLVPILAVVAGVAQGTTVFTNAARLRLKESDRLETTARLLRSVGGKAETTEDSLIVTGVDRYHGGTVDSCNDHRIAMAAAVAATRATGTVTLENPAAVAKSWPDFFTVCGTLR